MAAGLNIKRNSRIFHISNECYIIYLGVRTDEEKPFLRVGNMEYIDDRILNVISNTVVSARFTGNPLFELKLDKSREINYIGDTAVIGRIKTFLNSFQLPSDGAVDYHSIKDREQRDVVYFYNNGNIKLNYKEEAIFDLYKRAEADRHFVQQCDEIKKNFARNPLRYSKYDFRDSGIVLSGENVLLYNGGRFFSAALGRDYFSRLAATGIDPDQIAIHYATIGEGEETEPSSHALIEMLKRSSYRNTPFTIYAKNPDYAKKISALFPGANVAGTGEKWSTPFSGMKIREGAGGLEAESTGYPLPLTIGDRGAVAGKMNLNPHTRTLSINKESGLTEITVPDGILCNIKGSPGTMTDMTEIYISRFVPLIKGFSPEDDYKASLAIQKLLKMLASVVDGDARSGLILRSTVFNFSDMLRNLHLGNDSILTFFLENSLCLLDLATTRAARMEGKIIKNIQSLQSDIKSLLVKSARADLLLPVAADIYTDEFPALLYRSVKSTAKKTDYALASEVAREILSEQDLSPRYYSDEKERLLKLIGMLESAGDLEVDKILESQKPAQPYRARSKEVVDQTGSGRENIPSDQEKPGSSAKGLKSLSRKGNRSLLWLLLIPLLLLAVWGGYKGVKSLKSRRTEIAYSGSNSNNSGTGTGTSNGTGSNGQVSGGTGADGTNSNGTGSDGAGTQSAGGTGSDGAGTQSAGGTGSDGTGTQTAGENGADGTGTQTVGGTGSDSTGARTSGDTGSESPGTQTNEVTETDGGTATTAGTNGNGTESQSAEKNTDSQVKLKDSSSETDNRETASETPVVKTEDRPSSAEEVRAYLNVKDFHISLVDIHLTSNKIAVDNHYRDLDYEVYDGADPDWIYPGNKLVLPDGSVHNVVKGDAIWYIAARYIRTTLERDIPVLEANQAKAEQGDKTAISVLEKLEKGSPCEAFREKVHEVLKN